jgi:hypothetical protein
MMEDQFHNNMGKMEMKRQVPIQELIVLQYMKQMEVVIILQ